MGELSDLPDQQPNPTEPSSTGNADPLLDAQAAPFLTARRQELMQYYSVLRNMLATYNQLILTANTQGGAFIIAIVSAAFLLVENTKMPLRLGALVLLAAAVLLCRNMQFQTDFFAGMLSHTTKITQQVEVLLLSYPDQNKTLTSWDAILITKKLRKDFPGSKFVKGRREFFKLLSFILWIVFVATTVFLAYDFRKTYFEKTTIQEPCSFPHCL